MSRYLENIIPKQSNEPGTVPDSFAVTSFQNRYFSITLGENEKAI